MHRNMIVEFRTLVGAVDYVVLLYILRKILEIFCVCPRDNLERYLGTLKN